MARMWDTEPALKTWGGYAYVLVCGVDLTDILYQSTLTHQKIALFVTKPSLWVVEDKVGAISPNFLRYVGLDPVIMQYHDHIKL